MLEFMYGEPIYSHQIPRAVRECAPYLLRQFPALADENADDVTAETLGEWSSRVAEKYGTMLSVEPLPAGVHLTCDPISELESMKNPAKH
ncbi:hypothetical protein MWN34_10845 [Ancylobacter sp. 6x-1]|uniref:DUF7736 domain-containing protein n=1 Tax=Ancylobacter crimeensis TaxID=2579147 RepID=A0ABT0DBS7_9HYPH|nr:hypothetical protein [Ancylobacter crimeensis]MCK0197410.1 hypothetical protein [Ancylobacter crimeensis]